MQIQLSDHFSYKRLLTFVFPSVVMMIFTSVYGVVDAVFVSNYAGKIAFAAVSFIMPFIMILGALGFMVGTGGSALVSKILGEGREKQANQYFSMIIIFAISSGVLLALLGAMGMGKITVWLGASEAIRENCILYGRLSMISLPCYILQNVFQSMFVAAGKPKLGLYVTLGAGMTNIALDFCFVGLLKWGVAGAACATIFSEYVGGLIPLVYFIRKNQSLLRLQKTFLHWKIIGRACINGSSEFLNIAASSLVNMLYNFRLMQYAGENGVAAYGVMAYVNSIFSAIYMGYSVGSASLVSYHYGAANHSELKNLFRKSMLLVGISGGFLVVAAEALTIPLTRIYVGYDRGLMELTRHGFFLYAFSYLPMGINVFGSAFFTALNNGKVSAAISFLRTLVFQSIMVLLLPLWLGMDGIWLAVSAAESLSLVFTTGCLIRYRAKYHYI